MAPKKIMFIRHAEKPDPEWGAGVTLAGVQDDESLTVRGWQRAGALARFFDQIRAGALKPDVIYASTIAKHSNSERPQETVAPLVALLEATSTVTLVTTFAKGDLESLKDDILPRRGTVLVAWEHTEIPTIVDLFEPDPPPPARWPHERFDMVWVLDATEAGWSFSQVPQLLLAGDSADLIGDEDEGASP